MGSVVALDLWDIHRTSKYLGVSTDWLYSETKAGRFPHVRVGRKLRFVPQQLERWVEEHMAGAVQAGR